MEFNDETYSLIAYMFVLDDVHGFDAHQISYSCTEILYVIEMKKLVL